MKRVSYLWILIVVCLFTSRPSLAWWTVLYPGTAKEAVQTDRAEHTNEAEHTNGANHGEEALGDFEIKWKVMEWLEQWF